MRWTAGMSSNRPTNKNGDDKFGRPLVGTSGVHRSDVEADYFSKGLQQWQKLSV
jgi:hypothetical protein